MVLANFLLANGGCALKKLHRAPILLPCQLLEQYALNTAEDQNQLLRDSGVHSIPLRCVPAVILL